MGFGNIAVITLKEALIISSPATRNLFMFTSDYFWQDPSSLWYSPAFGYVRLFQTVHFLLQAWNQLFKNFQLFSVGNSISRQPSGYWGYFFRCYVSRDFNGQHRRNFSLYEQCIYIPITWVFNISWVYIESYSGFFVLTSSSLHMCLLAFMPTHLIENDSIRISHITYLTTSE